MRNHEGKRGDETTEDLEIRLVLECIYRRVGFDFRDYAAASIRRRILAAVHQEQSRTISGLQEKLLHDPGCMERILSGLTVHATSMFRDPGFFLFFRQMIVPFLKSHPFVRIWHAGCSSGQEVYSMAILLQEEGIYDRCRIYATDVSDAVLRDAKDGIFPLASMKENTENYQLAGGLTSFSEYFTASYDRALFHPSLQRNIAFSAHNLATDGSFNEFHVILCRNVMIYFNGTLQARVHNLLFASLARFGVLCLGHGESMQFTPHEASYHVLDSSERVYRRSA